MFVITDQFVEFLEFVTIGIIISIIFDFFRAYRKVKKSSDSQVIVQDILAFCIIICILIFSIINILDSSLRLYIFLAILLGIFSYVLILSSYIIKVYEEFFKIVDSIFYFIFLPVTFLYQIILKIYNFFKNIIKKCCKKFFNVVSLICRKKTVKKSVKSTEKEKK